MSGMKRVEGADSAPAGAEGAPGAAPAATSPAHDGSSTCMCAACKAVRTTMMSVDPGCSVPPYISPEERARDRAAGERKEG